MISGWRVVVVAILVLAFALARLAHARWRRGLHDEPGASHPPLPASIRTGASRTWVVFTTPMCASCDAVLRTLERDDPDASVVKVDATVELALASAYDVRSAPTVLLANAAGEVETRLVGAAGVAGYLGRAAA